MKPLLDAFRVLDLTDHKGFFCGKILGDLGADVVKIEKPGGDPARHLGPFYGNTPDPEKNLHWFAYNLNKRGITLDIETPGGKTLFTKLVRNSHFVIESYPVGTMDKLGLGYSALSALNPRIVLTSITPFGPCTDTGPTSVGLYTPRPPPSIIAGPAMPIEELRVATIRSQQPSSAALPAKQRPDVIPTSGTRPESPPK